MAHKPADDLKHAAVAQELITLRTAASRYMLAATKHNASPFDMDIAHEYNLSKNALINAINNSRQEDQ